MVKNTKRKINTRKKRNRRGIRNTRKRIMRGGGDTLEESFESIRTEVTTTRQNLNTHYKKWEDLEKEDDNITISVQTQIEDIENENKQLIQTLNNENLKLGSLLFKTKLETVKSVREYERVIKTANEDAKKTTLRPESVTSIITNVTNPQLNTFDQLKTDIGNVKESIDNILYGEKSNATIIYNIKTTMINKRMDSYNEMLDENNLEKLTVQDALYMEADYKYLARKDKYNKISKVSVFINHFKYININLTSYAKLMRIIGYFTKKIEENSALEWSKSVYSVRILTTNTRKVLQNAIPGILNQLHELHSQILNQRVDNVIVRIQLESQFKTIKTNFEILCNADQKCKDELSKMPDYQ